MAYMIFPSPPLKHFNKLKKRKYLIPTSNPNRLFDIMADRGVDYEMNIPGSKFHNHIVKYTTADKAFMKAYGYHVTDETYDVLVLEYDEAYCKNPRYFLTYLLKQIGE